MQSPREATSRGLSNNGRSVGPTLRDWKNQSRTVIARPAGIRRWRRWMEMRSKTEFIGYSNYAER